MEWLLQAERQDHLEYLEDSNDPEARETSRMIAKWIKHFLGPLRESMVMAEEAFRHPEPPAETEYMDHDSDGGNGPVPEGIS
jgi:hypothetical protein